MEIAPVAMGNWPSAFPSVANRCFLYCTLRSRCVEVKTFGQKYQGLVDVAHAEGVRVVWMWCHKRANKKYFGAFIEGHHNLSLFLCKENYFLMVIIFNWYFSTFLVNLFPDIKPKDFGHVTRLFGLNLVQSKEVIPIIISFDRVEILKSFRMILTRNHILNLYLGSCSQKCEKVIINCTFCKNRMLKMAMSKCHLAKTKSSCPSSTHSFPIPAITKKLYISGIGHLVSRKPIAHKWWKVGWRLLTC